MYKAVVILLLCCAFAQANAQQPYWTTRVPIEEGKNYYYRVTKAEATTYEEAYQEAFSNAILESSWRLGIKVNTMEEMQAMNKSSAEKISIEKSQLNIAMNKVCEYHENLTAKMGVRIFVLWQVAKYGNVSPEFDEFNKCE